jgi:hypothetical protein
MDAITYSKLKKLNIKVDEIDISNVSDDVILSKLKNVDGTGSGLDADMLDGKHASDFTPAVHSHTKSVISDFV